MENCYSDNIAGWDLGGLTLGKYCRAGTIKHVGKTIFAHQALGNFNVGIHGQQMDISGIIIYRTKHLVTKLLLDINLLMICPIKRN